ncbi:hypothetical protein ACNQUF_12745, partial [Corynebacterium diphtheriae]
REGPGDPGLLPPVHHAAGHRGGVHPSDVLKNFTNYEKGQEIPASFHRYTMQQAIEEEFIPRTC